MKYEWRKQEKELYLPKAKPTELTVPKQNFYTITGKGDPNGEQFGEEIAALYAMSYGIRMMPKRGITPEGYFEYTVYPLEGIWTMSDEAIIEGRAFDKADLVYKIMIRQPEFVTEELALNNLAEIAEKKPNPNNQHVKFESIEDGRALQMLHVGPYDDEAKTFEIMTKYCEEHQLQKRRLDHREIYLSDPRKSAPEKMKTVLRYFLEE
ncbi:GyrI-like domain-containing protein [Enterococcus wangshanyuanii]|uniref:GyrI-like small molecule binding domain-containing protein n=1 Tax=Enterococcus wangshanyuanii TaxID=2005703 RepID=A0ABQ1PG17_9ENTE|nr:GyrI-like domain-containing protein [Enterococcus wangshanyuanii]GGC96650.1 hypothetical protein GCM10011573_27790 [Enterococcus wangshanyuanii]